MRHAIAAMTAMACLMACPPMASATIGDDDRIELLGYEPVDRKLYYLLHVGGTGDPPRLHFLPLGEADPDTPRAVQSWYAGTLDAVTKALPGRLAELKARLTPLPAADLEAARLVVLHGPLALCSTAREKPTGAALAALLARGVPGEPETPVCRTLDLSVRWHGFRGSARVESWSGVELLSAHELPGGDFAVAVVRYTGKHFETGYAVEQTVLMRRSEDKPPR